MTRVQPYAFGFSDAVCAEAAKVPLDALHRDVDAMVRAAEAIVPVAERLGVPPPKPHLAGFAYCHVSTLGAEVVFAEGSEPNVVPMLRAPEEIDRLEEPADYLARGVVPERLRTLEALRARVPDAPRGIGHVYEGPITTAMLLMGQDFLMLPYDDPARAHKLLAFCVESALRYREALLAHWGEEATRAWVGIPDDFAGMLPPELFPEFVVPYLERMYAGQGATERFLHSELLREDHLPFLKELKIDTYDPSADQYLTPERLREVCPVPFTGRIQSWHMNDLSAEALRAMYRSIAACDPVSISMYMTQLDQEEKVAALLEVARELADEPVSAR